MTIEASDVLTAAGAGLGDSDLAGRVLTEAIDHVGNYIEKNLIDDAKPVPDSLRDGAILTCAVDLFARRKAPFGVQMVPDGTGEISMTRLGADPLGGVRPMLSSYCFEIGFAYPEDSA